MNTVWSDYVQGENTLYFSRKLRFHPLFRAQYAPCFDLDETKPLRILEVGCGPGALAGALHRWFPAAAVVGLDRDSNFIRFAREHEPGVTFEEGDATALPYPEGSFDVTISNTVSEHIEPHAFFSEQRRVLKPGGICLVLSARRGLRASAPCLSPSKVEEAFWEKYARVDDSMSRFSVCQYPLSEAELPRMLEECGFRQLRSGYALIDLTPDHPRFPPEMARAMIDAERLGVLDALDAARRIAPETVTEGEVEALKAEVEERFARRLEQYDRGEKQWDTAVSVTQVVRGVK